MARPTQATFPNGSIFASDAAQIDQPDSRWAAAYEGGEGKTPPAAGVHNYEFNRLDVFGQHLEKNGMADWDARTIYPLYGWAKGSDGMLYRSRLNGNTSNNPVGGNGTAWRSLSDIVSPQATESLAGIAEIATQAETSAGTDDSRVVTPKKLRLGFSITLGANGSISFPTWMGGLVIKWGQFDTGSIGNNATGSHLFPSGSFPNNCHQVIVGSTSGVASGSGDSEGFFVQSVAQTGFDWKSDWNARDNSYGPIRYIAIGS